MQVKQVILEDFVNYKKPSLFLGSCFCDWKCCREANIDTSVCQNKSLYDADTIDLEPYQIYALYTSNPITKAVVIGGLEPMIQINEVIELIDFFRKNGEDCPFIVYTGYYPQEIPKEITRLKLYSNIVIKFGRFVPDEKSHFDDTLGVSLVSPNQYAEKIS